MSSAVGDQLPEWRLPRDADARGQHRHRDPRLPGRAPRPRPRAQSYGSQDIFVNILTTNGLVQRYVTDWAGHDVHVRSIAIRLGAPAYPGDELVFTGSVVEVDGATASSSTWSATSASARTSPGRWIDIATIRSRPRMTALSGAAAIVGIGATEFSKESGRSELQLVGRGDAGGAGRLRADAGRRRRADDVHHGLLLGDRARPRAGGGATCGSSAGSTTAAAPPAAPSSRRRWRSRPVWPTWWSATAASTSAPGSGSARCRSRRTPRSTPTASTTRWSYPQGLTHAGRDGGDAGAPLHARVRRHVGGLRPGRGRRPQARRHQPERVLLRQADHARGPPGLADDRRAAAPARLLPGERRRGGDRGGLGRAGARPARSRRRTSRRRRRAARRTSS